MSKLITLDVDFDLIKEELKDSDYNTLAYELMVLEVDFDKISPYLSLEQVDLYYQLMELYEEEKNFRIEQESLWVEGKILEAQEWE